MRVCLFSVFGLGIDITPTHRVARGNKGDFWGVVTLEETPSLLDGLWSEAVQSETSEGKHIIFFIFQSIIAT